VRRSLAVLVCVLLAVLTVVAQTPQQGAGQQPAGAPAAGPAPAEAPAGSQAGPPAGRGRGGPPARIVTFEARPATIKPGESTVLNWLVENPAAPAIEPGIGRVTPRGTQRVTPAATTTYTLTMGDLTRSVTVTVTGTKPAAAGTPAAAASTGIPRTPDGKPDFSGVYGFGGGGGRGGRGAAGRGQGAAPAGPQLKPGAEKYRVQRGPQDTGRTADCMPLIPPDAFGVPYEFQIIQNRNHLVIIHEYPGTFRIVPLDGEPHQVDPDPAWLGDSVGRWEGDTLIIDTIGYNEKTEIAGYRHTDALHTVERLRRVEGGFDYEITIEDPNVFVAPFTQTRSFRLTAAPMKRIMEFICENNRDYRPLFGTPGAAAPPAR
jgi:hypothetical protein